MADKKITRKLSVGILTLIGIIGCLCITTFAVLFLSISVSGNTFETGGIGINLNDGKPVIEKDEFLFEPGMTVEKDFFVENTGTDGLYYKLYFDEVSGDLADALEVTVKDGESVILSGKITELTEEAGLAAEDALAFGERRDLKIIFHFPENSENNYKDKTLSFIFYAKAVQSRNNDGKVFD